MIKQIDNRADIPCKELAKTWCGRKIVSYLYAYDTGYDFCRFFKSGRSFIMLINSTMLIWGNDFDSDELNGFVNINMPFRIEGDQEALSMIKNNAYMSLHRTIFQLIPGNGMQSEKHYVNFDPKLDDVYGILSEGFPNIADHPLWLADTSHRIRHGISRVFTYRNSTTASLAFDVEGFVLVAQVATKISARGSGYARKFLTWLADWLDGQGKTAALYALDIRESFYKEIGFKVISEEFVLERKENNNEENILKGTLQYND